MRGLLQHSEGVLSPDCRANRVKQQSSGKAAAIRPCLLSQDSFWSVQHSCIVAVASSLIYPATVQPVNSLHFSMLQSAAASLCKHMVSGEVYKATVRQQQVFVSRCAEGTNILVTCTSRGLPWHCLPSDCIDVKRPGLLPASQEMHRRRPEL